MIEKLTSQYPVYQLCLVFEVTRSGYYAWLKGQETPREVANRALMTEIGRIHEQKRGRYFLAELLRLNLLPTGHIYERQTRPVRDLLRRRMLLVRQRTTLILSFKSLHERTLGRRVATYQIKTMKAEQAQACFSHPADQLCSAQQIGLMSHFTDAITKLEKHILKVASQWSSYQALQTLPGIGKILGLTMALETGEVQRFASAGNFASYCRCVKSVRQSNNKKKGENNRKCGRAGVRGL